MTQPNPDDAKAAAEKAAAAKAPKVDLLTVGHYVWEDPILHTKHDEFAVVTKVDGGTLTVRPLHKHSHTVEAAEFTPLSADDVG